MLDGSDTALAKNENETSGSGVRRRLTCVYNDGKCGDGGVGENVKFCRGEQRCFLTRYGDVRQGVILRGKLVDARLEIVRKGLVPCQFSLPEFKQRKQEFKWNFSYFMYSENITFQSL